MNDRRSSKERVMTKTTGGWERYSGLVTDAVRVITLLSALVTLGDRPAEVPLRFGLIFGLLLATRFLDLPRPFETAFALLLVASGWASALGWYFEHPRIDIPIHFALTGTAAALTYVGLVRADLLSEPPRPCRGKSGASVALLVMMIGATLGVIWEQYEWLAENYVPSRILVGYDDAIGDLTNGLLGALVAGVLMTAWLRSGHGLRAPD